MACDYCEGPDGCPYCRRSPLAIDRRSCRACRRTFTGATCPGCGKRGLAF